ncbi:spermatogenesis-associated protein 6-like isoform X4 [Tubulanus polymorphus]|uniref:spermatogenesis-associated protein 6-like isoform X4 n=1 Tax=Tubulanus polymorphus TaxID=672921 RepID=UPI003DA49CDC
MIRFNTSELTSANVGSVRLSKYLQVSCPGTWLANKDECYLRVCIFGQHKRTPLEDSTFPMPFYTDMKFEKVFWTAIDPADVMDKIAGDPVYFELIQVDLPATGTVLATYEVNARDFLYPFPHLAPGLSQDRNALMQKTDDFPFGISPRLEFSTKTTISETDSPYTDMFESSLRGIVDESLIGRVSGMPAPKQRRCRKKKNKRSCSVNASSHSISPSQDRIMRAGLYGVYRNDSCLPHSDKCHKTYFPQVFRKTTEDFQPKIVNISDGSELDIYIPPLTLKTQDPTYLRRLNYRPVSPKLTRRIEQELKNGRVTEMLRLKYPYTYALMHEI